MKNNLLHERTCRRFSTILLCGLLSLGAATAVAQSPQGQSQRTIKGTVVDEAGDPIPGANVIVQGTSRGWYRTSPDSSGFLRRIPIA